MKGPTMKSLTTILFITVPIVAVALFVGAIAGIIETVLPWAQALSVLGN